MFPWELPAVSRAGLYKLMLALETPKGEGGACSPAGDSISPADPKISRLARLLLLDKGMHSCTAFPLSGPDDLVLADFEGESNLGDEADFDGESTLGEETGDAVAEEGLDLGSFGSFIVYLGQVINIEFGDGA